MIIFIAAQDDSRGIGYRGRVPWSRMKADRERLQRLTSGKVIAMGRKSYEEFRHVKSAFSQKEVLVISNSRIVGSQATVTIGEIKNRAKTEDIWVLGGGQIFQLLLPYVQKMYITQIEGSFPADSYFPKYEKKDWSVVYRETFDSDNENPEAYSFTLLERRHHI